MLFRRIKGWDGGVGVGEAEPSLDEHTVGAFLTLYSLPLQTVLG